MKCETRTVLFWQKKWIANFESIWEESEATVLKLTSVEL
jgi:hypothetical protein